MYYKSLTIPGGAERLFLKEYEYFLEMGYDVYVIVNKINSLNLNTKEIDKKRLIIIDKRFPFSIFKLATKIRQLGKPFVLCSSGDIDIYLASFFTKFIYALHIHHPIYMSFNDYDKYSIFLKKWFKKYIKSNYGAARFLNLSNELTTTKKIKLNFRAFFSIKAKRKAKKTFVLSRFSKKEKLDLYKISSDVLYGAIENNSVNLSMKNKKNNFRIFTVARLDINKRIDILIKTVYELIKKEKKIELIIAGEGPERAKLEELINELGMKKFVKLIGFISDDMLSDEFRRADIFITIDWADYKISMFEALAHGVPVIVSNETECDLRLIKSKYVMRSLPKVKSLEKIISLYMDNRLHINKNEIKNILDEYTWSNYFYKIAMSLSNNGLISAPSNKYDK